MEHTIFLVLLLASLLIGLTGYTYGKEQGYEKGFDDGYETAKENWELEEEFLNKYNRDAFILMKGPPDTRIIVISIISILLSIIVICFFCNPFALPSFAVIISLLIASIGMAIYYLFARKRLFKREKREIIFCITIWLLLVYGIVYNYGLIVVF